MADPVKVSELPYFPGPGSDAFNCDMLFSPEFDGGALTKDQLYRMAGGQFMGAIMDVATGAFNPKQGAGPPVDGTNTGPWYCDNTAAFKLYVGFYDGSQWNYQPVTV